MNLTLDNNGIIKQAAFVASPNHDARPADTVIDSIIIHAISLPPQQYGGCYIDDLFCNRLDPDADPYFADICQLKVSAHCLIRRNGELVQFVSFPQRAWHAGESSLAGKDCVNDFSIGIELEGCDEEAFEDAQYQTLVKVTRLLIQEYRDITEQRIAGHNEIAPGRKTDPGPEFDWLRFKLQLDVNSGSVE